MMRQPKQVHVWLYRQTETGWEYAIFQRSDALFCWQGVCGGLEDAESPEEGVRRELCEEAGVTGDFPLYRLECISFLQDDVFGQKHRARWGKDVVVIPMFFFAAPWDGEIHLSREHTEVRWLPYEQAYDLIYFHDQKVALYELHQRLLRGNLIRNHEKG